jgi:hypothetical protein
MKKQYTKILIISIVCAILSFTLLYFTPTKSNTTYYDLNSNIDNDGEISDPEGYAILITTFGKLAVNSIKFIGDIFSLIMLVFPILATLSLIALLQIIARLVQIGKEKKWKNVTSKVLTIISIVFQAWLCLVLIFDLVVLININKILMATIMIVNIVATVLYIVAICHKKESKTIDNNIVKE